MLCAKESMAAARRFWFAAERGIGVKHFEIVERRFLLTTLLSSRIALDRAIEDLTKAKFYLAEKIRDHAAHVVADNFQRGQLVEER